MTKFPTGLALLVAIATATAVTPNTAHAQSLAFTPVTVIDVREGVARPDMTVIVADGQITAVRPADSVEVPANARVVDGTGKFLIPGLWDMHAHTSSDWITREILLPLFVANGVTGVRNMAADCFETGEPDCGEDEFQIATIDDVREWRRQIATGRLIGPRIVAGSYYVNSPPPGEPSTPQYPRTAEHGRAHARLLDERGVDFIKIYNMLSREGYFALADEAKRLGLPFAGHVPVAVRASEASEVGQRSIEHCCAGSVLTQCSAREDELRDREVARLGTKKPEMLPLFLQMVESYDAEKCAELFATFVENGTWFVPTLMISRLPSEVDTGWRDDPRVRFLPPEERQVFAELEEFYERLTGERTAREPYARWVRTVTEAMDRAGVRVLAGTDAGYPGIYWGSALHEELELLITAGLTEADALRAATLEPARYLEATDSLGTVEAGKLADLVLLDANPLEDIRNTRRIRAVVARGRLFDRAALDGLLAEVERAANGGTEGSGDLPPTAKGSPTDDAVLGDSVLADTTRYVEVVDGRTIGSWRTWKEGPRTRGYEDDRYDHFPRTEHLKLDASGLPVRLEATGQIGDGVPWYERFKLFGDTARWFTPRTRGEASLDDPAFYETVHPAIDIGVLARALLRHPSRELPLLPEGRARLEALGERVAESDGRRRTVRLFAVHGMDLYPRYVWLDEEGATFADEWSVLQGWEAAFPALRAAVDSAVAEDLRELAGTVTPPPRTGSLVIRGARLFDPATGEVGDGTTIIVEGERVAAVGPDGTVAVPEGAEVLEADGRMAIPGLWDVHAHLRNPAQRDQIFMRGGEALHLAAGVTSVRDMGSHMGSLVALRTAIEAGEALGPRIEVAGFIYDTAQTDVIERPVANAAEARALVDRYADMGFPQVKLHLDGSELVRAAIARAEQHGMRVVGHLPFDMTSREAVEAGYDEMTHIWWMVWGIPRTNDESFAAGETSQSWHQVFAELSPDSEPVREFVSLLAERGVAVDPTIGVFASESVPPEYIADEVDRLPPSVARYYRHKPYFPNYFPRSPLARDAREEGLSNLMALLPTLHEAGVPILPGTDTWPGFGLHYELELYVEAGIPAPEVLRLATLGAAREMGRANDLGTIEPGKLADLILVDGVPTADISDIRRVTTVIKDGRVYDAAAIYRALGVEPCCED